MTDTATTAQVERLFSAGAHFAQAKARRHPSMKPFIAGVAGRQEIIDLAATVAQLNVAKSVLTTLAREGKTVIFVGGKIEIASLIKKAANEVSAPYVSARWLGGTISNWSEIKKRIDRLAELSDESPTGFASKSHTKLELVRLGRERERLETRLDGVVTLTKRPDALLVVDTRHEKHAVKEARDAGIPIIAIMSSDCDAKDATYPIVANDASRETVGLILDELVSAFKEGRAG